MFVDVTGSSSIKGIMGREPRIYLRSVGSQGKLEDKRN